MNPTLPWRCCVIVLLAALAACSTPRPRTGDIPERSAASDQSDAEHRARVRLELASAYFGRGQLDTALDEVKLALAAKPDLAEGYGLRGLIYAAMGDDGLAGENFRRALDLNPRSGDLMHNYGWFLCQRQRFAEAATQFQAALAQPQYRDTVRTLLARGVCLARNGQWLEAEGSLMRAYELDPSNLNTAVSLSEVLYKRGDFERARFHIDRVNSQPSASNAQTLWLAARIERKLGNTARMRTFTDQLKARFPQAPETALLDQGRFDE